MENLQIDRAHVQATFKEYVSHYNPENDKVALKIAHTYRVAELCDRIAESIGLAGNDRDIAWLLGMLHDVGRFEQVKRFDSFMDADTVDHAKFGADLLFGPEEGSNRLTEEERAEGPLIESYVPGLLTHPERAMIERAIRVHNDFRIPEGLSDRDAMFCHIIRDADKVDIFRINLDFPMENIYNCTTEELKNNPVAAAVMQAVDEEHCVLRSVRETAVDQIVGHICLTYELVYPLSLRITMEQGYLDRLMNFASDNETARQQFVHIREKLGQYIERKLKE